MADRPRVPAVAGKLIGAVCAALMLLGIAASPADAATIGCGQVTTFVAPNSASALNGGDGWLIFAKPDGTSEKVILRSGTTTPSGGISGYVCVGSDGVYFTGLVAPGTAGYVPQPAGSVPGTGVYCGTVAMNPFASGQMSGPRTLRLRGALSAYSDGIFTVPTSIVLPTIGSYLCGRFSVGGPSQLVGLLGAGEPGYVPQGLPNTSTAPATPTRRPENSPLVLIASLGVLALLAKRTRSVST